MSERGIDIADVLRVLRNGYVDSDPIRNEQGRWQCEISLKLVGRRAAACITIIVDDGRLKIRTVIWKDES